MPRNTRNSRQIEEDPEGLLNHCNACGDYHDGITGPECPIYLEEQAKKKKKVTPPKKPKKDSESDLGSTKVVSLLENIALGMDQLLKQSLTKSQHSPDEEEGNSGGARRRSKSVPPSRRKAKSKRGV